MNKENFKEEKFSPSETRGINLLTDTDLLIYAPGVSTGGIAEMKMAMNNLNRRVIATTIDEGGVEYARKMIDRYNLSDKIEVKLENVSEPLPYKDNNFDFVYARLVLHYLSRQDLDKSLKEIYRILRPDKKFFVVVRSTECRETKWPDSVYEEKTGFTYVIYTDPNSGKKVKSQRYFHTEESITSHLIKAGFEIESVVSYKEQLYMDFERKLISPELDSLIEVVAKK